MSTPLTGRVVAITGGARGIGYQTAQSLIARGCRVAIGDIDEARLKEAAAELGITTYAVLDVTDPESIHRFLDTVETELGPIDVMINNAGIMPTGHLEDEDDVMSRRMVEINVLGVVSGTKQAARRMLPRKHGHIINIASLAGEMVVPGLATYCATKHAVVGFTESARLEFAGRGVQVSAVLPTFTNTELVAGTAGAKGIRNAEPQEIADAIASLIAKPRPAVRVTRLAGTIVVVTKVLPKRAVAAVGKVLGADSVFLDDVDAEARRGYLERIRGN